MVDANGDWLRVRGLGRERFATYLADYLTTLGYVITKESTESESESRFRGRLERMNPAVPPGATEVAFRVYPTSGGAALVWEGPKEIRSEERSRMDRFVREIVSYLERAILTESHATAKVIRPSTSRLPWEPAPARPLGDPADGSETGPSAGL